MKTQFVVRLGKWIAGAALIAACGADAAPTAAPAPAVPAEAQKFSGLKGDPANGKAKYETTCIACHGPDAKGVTGLGKDLTTSAFLKALSDPEAALFLSKGRPSSDPLNTTKVDMPPKGGNPALKDQDLIDIVAFLRTLQK
jgi:disulfide bond formation protein DsbB